ncbi:MAG: N-acetylneuraminate synthase [Chloroflexi bacterium]|nr:N-acetylneuraminate synthase [Chloroflexota bacterium]
MLTQTQQVKLSALLREGHTFFIAEAGVNHNGDVEMAHRLIDAASDAGADAVKFQTFTAEGVATLQAPKAGYQVRTTGSNGSQYEMLKRLELPEEAYSELIAHCESRAIMFMSTPHDWAAIDFLDRIDVAAFKIGSGDLTNIPYLKAVASKQRPIILSTGMSNLGEIEEAVEAITSQGNRQLTLLHCVTNYPADPEDCNLRAMQTLSHAFGFPVGYSDHTVGMEAALAAVALGAVIIEKHFTLDRSLPGPDHEASLEPDELRALIEGIRKVECMLGNGIKAPTTAELDMRPIARKSIVTAVALPKGAVITPSMITTKRPGTGILPRYWDTVVGKMARVEIEADTTLRWDDLA